MFSFPFYAPYPFANPQQNIGNGWQSSYRFNPSPPLPSLRQNTFPSPYFPPPSSPMQNFQMASYLPMFQQFMAVLLQRLFALLSQPKLAPLPAPSSPPPASTPKPANFDSPFGMHTGFSRPEESTVKDPTESLVNGHYNDSTDIGVDWERPAIAIKQNPQILGLADIAYGKVPNGMNILGNFAAPNEDRTYQLRVPPQQYMQFVRDVAERYDGDGLNDMPGLTNPIHYWQIGNEPADVAILGRLTNTIDNRQAMEAMYPEFIKRQREEYAQTYELTATAVKAANPNAKLVMGGLIYANDLEHFYAPVLEKLGGKNVDVFDIHWYGDYTKVEDLYNSARQMLDKYGYQDTEIWLTETGTFSGQFEADGVRSEEKSESDQAADVIKSMLYPLSLGVKKTFWAWGIVEGFGDSGGKTGDDNLFNHTGFIYDGQQANDPGYGVKKLSYYTYKKMTEMLQGIDVSQTKALQKEENGVYLLEFTKKDGTKMLVAWNDSTEEKDLSVQLPIGAAKITQAIPNAESGQEVTDYASAFSSEIQELQGDLLSLKLGKSPVFIEGV